MVLNMVKARKWSWVMFLFIVVGAAVAFTISAGVTVGVASAYNDTGSLPCKWWHSSNTALEPEYRYHPIYPPTGSYLSAFNAAIADWNSSDTPVNFDYDTGQTAHTIGVENTGSNGHSGYTYWRCWNFGKRSYTYAYINSGVVPSDALYAIRRGVAAHELGHYIGLSHSLHAPALMDVRDAVGDIYRVKLDDECGVNDRYTHSSYQVDCSY